MRPLETGFSYKMKEFLSTQHPIEWLSDWWCRLENLNWPAMQFPLPANGSPYNSKLEKSHSCARGQASVYPSSCMSPVVTHPSVTGRLLDTSHLKLLALHFLLFGFSECLLPCGNKPVLLYMAQCYFLLKSKLTEDQDVGTQILVCRWQSSPAKIDYSPFLGAFWSHGEDIIRFRY